MTAHVHPACTVISRAQKAAITVTNDTRAGSFSRQWEVQSACKTLSSKIEKKIFNEIESKQLAGHKARQRTNVIRGAQYVASYLSDAGGGRPRALNSFHYCHHHHQQSSIVNELKLERRWNKGSSKINMHSRTTVNCTLSLAAQIHIARCLNKTWSGDLVQSIAHMAHCRPELCHYFQERNPI